MNVTTKILTAVTEYMEDALTLNHIVEEPNTHVVVNMDLQATDMCVQVPT